MPEQGRTHSPCGDGAVGEHGGPDDRHCLVCTDPSCRYNQPDEPGRTPSDREAFYWRERLGFALGRLTDRWCVRGYHTGTFRNGFAWGFTKRLDDARTPARLSSQEQQQDHYEAPGGTT